MAGTDVTTAWSNLLPTVDLSLRHGRYIQGPREVLMDVPVGIDSSGNYLYEQRMVTQDKTDRGSHTAAISLNHNLWDFGRSSNAIRQAKAGEESSRYNYDDLRLIVIASVKRAYFELLKSKQLLGVYETAVKLAEDQLKEAQTRHDIGLIPKAEVYA